ncbi:winged helix-turn-helix domain-containing protein [Streptomyces goshikiensis]|uniref:helix-turn-helix domain-containing protein n=1 Tax=Streptomyces goshikiensis TaxID=1942 RepID=UPI0037160124
MRYPQGGGLTSERPAFREALRLKAAGWFGGRRALRSRGPMCRPKIGPRQFALLEAELDKGPVAHGWPDQTWTLARIQAVISRRLRVSMSIAAVYQTMRCGGWSRQAPARHALERQDAAVTGWIKDTWPHVE